MKQLTISFLKIFIRNRRAMFFILILPAGVLLIAAFLGLERIVRIDQPLSYNAFLLSGIVAFAMMNTGLYTVAYTLIDYRQGAILKRFAATPLRPGQFLLSQILARFVIALVQTALLLALGIWLFDLTFSLNMLLLPLVIFLGSTIFLHFGFLIAYLARDYEEAAPYTSVAGLVLVFLGDVFFPIQNLPESLNTLGNILPLKPLAVLLRQTLFAGSLTSALPALLVLLIWLLFLSGVGFAVFAGRTYK